MTRSSRGPSKGAVAPFHEGVDLPAQPVVALLAQGQEPVPDPGCGLVVGGLQAEHAFGPAQIECFHGRSPVRAIPGEGPGAVAAVARPHSLFLGTGWSRAFRVIEDTFRVAELAAGRGPFGGPDAVHVPRLVGVHHPGAATGARG